MERIGTLLRRLKLDPDNLRVAAARQSAAHELVAVRPGGDEPPAPEGSTAHTLVEEVGTTGELEVDGNSGESARPGVVGMVKDPSPPKRPVLRVLAGGRGRRSAQPPQNGFPRPALRLPLMLVVDNGHAVGSF